MEDLPLFPEQASTVAGRVDLLYWFMTALTVFFVVLIAGMIILFAIRYRRRHENEVPKQISGSTRLEVGLMVPLFGLAMLAFTWGAWLYSDMVRPPENALEIYVVGKQWMWKLYHPDGQQEINELHVPVGRPIQLTMTSQDVIHSFFVPAFRVKQDVIPGRYSTLWFEATETGEFHLFCTEYCGTEHAGMIGTVVVMEERDYQEWLTGEGSDPVGMGSPRDAGETLYTDLGCAGCHRLEGAGPGPSLVGIFGQSVQLESGETVVVDETYIRTSILNPNAQIHAGYQPIMPTYEGQVSEEQILQLITYIRSLGNEETEGDR
jgi:cytochrome c oxidase subunit II